jgi:hypothetical protein
MLTNLCMLLLLLGVWMVSSFRALSQVYSQKRILSRGLLISPSDEDKVMKTVVANVDQGKGTRVPDQGKGTRVPDQGKGLRVPLAKGFGQSSTLGADATDDVETPSQSGRTRSEKKAEYRKLASMAKRSSSLHKMLGGSGTDIFQAQRKQGNRGSGGA